jgi:hypothetical protein
MYIIRGVVLGRTNLQFTAGQKAYNAVASQNRQVQVFPPLRLSPRNITLIIGAVFQVSGVARKELIRYGMFFLLGDGFRRPIARIDH